MQNEDQVVANADEVTEETAAAVTQDSNAVEIPDMPYEQLEQVHNAVTKKLRAGREKAKANDINTVKALVAKHGLKWSDIKPAAPTSKSSGTVPAKYRNPETGATWTGRGRAPVWIADQDRDQFLIDKAPAA